VGGEQLRALYSDEEGLLRDSISSQVEKLVPTGVADLLAFDDAELWRRLADGYLLGLGIPEDQGGAGTLIDATIVATALATVVAPVPYLGGAVLPGRLLVAAGAPAELIARLVAGELRLAVGLDPTLTRVAQLGRDDDVLAWDAAGASAALVLGADRRLVAIALGDATPSFDLTRRMRRCAPTSLVDLGDLGAPLSDDALIAWESAAMVMLAADTVGLMHGAVQLAVDHAEGRIQFGVAIGSFQAVQHLIAEAHVDADGGRGLVNHAAWTVDHRPAAEAAEAARVAKAYCAAAGKRVCEAVIQVHGGMGMTWDSRVHLFQRRAMTDRMTLGDETFHYARIAES
jgi:alkylation response protein AidB-like acyl-CoA dehydrogenase